MFTLTQFHKTYRQLYEIFCTKHQLTTKLAVIWSTFLIKLITLSRLSVAGHPCASQPHRPGMAEDVRAVLSQFHEEHPEQHGLKVAAVAEHDLYLERGFVLIAMVGQVSVHCMRICNQTFCNILRVKWGNLKCLASENIYRVTLKVITYV